MKEYEINGVVLSNWTNEFLEKCEEVISEELSETDIVHLLDYAVGFGFTDDLEDLAKQTVEAVFHE